MFYKVTVDGDMAVISAKIGFVYILREEMNGVYCRNCGEKLQAEMKYCNKCGKRVVADLYQEDLYSSESFLEKKKGKKNNHLVMIVVTIIVLVLCLLGNELYNGIIAKNQLVAFLDGYKEKNTKIADYLIGSSDGEQMDFNGISAYFAEEMTYVIGGNKKDGENYVIKVEINTIDFESLFIDSYQKTIEKYGEEGIESYFLSEMEQNIKECNFKIKTTQCEIVLVKVNSTFKIVLNNEFANALSGGMNEYLYSMQGGEF